VHDLCSSYCLIAGYKYEREDPLPRTHNPRQRARRMSRDGLPADDTPGDLPFMSGALLEPPHFTPLSPNWVFEVILEDRTRLPPWIVFHTGTDWRYHDGTTRNGSDICHLRGPYGHFTRGTGIPATAQCAAQPLDLPFRIIASSAFPVSQAWFEKSTHTRACLGVWSRIGLLREVSSEISTRAYSFAWSYLDPRRLYF
jgi:hypothetical protein